MGEKVLVIGAARSGLAGASFLAKHKHQVILSDMKEIKQAEELQAQGITVQWGQQPDVEAIGPDYLLVSPGVPLTIPPIVYAKANGIPVIGELELAYRNCRAPFVAITGTNGKTTTTTLTGELLKRAYGRVFVGGNIGVPLIQQAEELTAEDVVVAEVSSFQLESIDTFRPHLALMINLTPDHLDRHGDMDGYLAAKSNIFVNQLPSDYLVLNYDDPAIRGVAERSNGKVLFFSQQHTLEEGVYLDGDRVMLSCEGVCAEVCHTGDIAIKGRHNLENAMGAILLAYLSGVTLADIKDVLMTFPGVEHRLEPVRTKDGVLFINDSKGTNPDSTTKAIEACDRPIVLILGGKGKGCDFTPLAQLVKEKVKQAVVLGQAKAEIVRALQTVGYEAFTERETFADAVQAAADLAQSGDVVLLSPACTSWDMFNSYEERGRLFKDIVNNL